MAVALPLGLSVTALAAAPNELVPMGDIIGIKASAGGAVVSDVTEIETPEGCVSPAKDGGILAGDIITGINGTEVNSARELLDALRSSEEGPVTIQYRRGGKACEADITPYRSDEGVFIGVWIRDAINGIGTVTFYDPENNTFGALGHAICDMETGELFPLKDGEITGAEVADITIGKPGTPGQLNGCFDGCGSIGEIRENSTVGIFGFADMVTEWNGRETVPVAHKSEICTGSATILSACSGEIEEYDIEIVRIYPDNDDGRSMMLKITDDELLKLTGGIVQGMSGSPIIQNGKLVGAVTHVLINDPTKGYGIFIEDMLEAAG